MGSSSSWCRMRLFIFLILMMYFQGVIGSGKIEVHFIRYLDSCMEYMNTNKCDPKFSFCLGRPQTRPSVTTGSCHYLHLGETGHWMNTNDITFGSNMKGVANPLIASTKKILDTEVMLAFKVRDWDLVDDDTLITMGTTLRHVYPSKEQSTWTYGWLNQSDYSVSYKYRMYCDANYYTSSCDVFCKSQDTGTGHYTCDLAGNKVCSKGWLGPNCNVDIDECTQGYCVRGECQNLPGTARCTCPANYTGYDCSQVISL